MAILTNEAIDLIQTVGDVVIPLAGMMLLIWIVAKIVEKLFK